MRIFKVAIAVISIACVISVIITGCLGKVSGPSQDFVYPLKVGNYWEYDFSSEHFDSETGEPSSLGPNTYTTATAEIIGMDTLEDTLETYVFYAEDDTSNINNLNSATAHINNAPDGLYQYASDGASLIAPAKPKPQETEIHFNGISYASTDELMARIYNIGQSLLSFPASYQNNNGQIFRGLAYPLGIGKQWTVVTLSEANPLHRIVKRITDWTKVKTNAGDFNCFKIQWLWDFNGDGIWDDNLVGYDYVSEKGLIVRELRIKGIIITDYSGQPLGTVDIVQRFELKKLDLK
ncbi:MAG: hypothetical protein V3V99_07865 [candidate division Zixibacteria bacterium]